MAGGGKTATSSSSVQIPPEVLARYNSVNAQAQTAANQPFQQYSTDPNAFVAPLNSTQQAAIANTNAYAGAAQPYYGAAGQALGAGVNAAAPLVGQSAGTIGQAQDVGNAYNQAAAQGYATAPGAADPYNQAAGTAYGAGLAAATPFTLAGGQAVNAQQIGGQQIGQFMSPYLGSVYNATLAGENMQNAQQASGLQGQAIQAGAFGGDRSGIAQANLAYQQNLANAQTNANILNTGYGQALGAAQQQQGVNLAAQQANRAALQTTGQNLYGQLTGTGQALAGLGQNVYGQQTGAAQGLAGVGNQAFGQGATTAAQQAALGNQVYGMGTGTAQTLGALGAGAQTAGLQGAQAQMAAGTQAQQTQQAGLSALYNQFLQQQAYPFQTAQFLANIAEGTGALSGSTTTTTQPMGLLAARGGSIRGGYNSGGLVPSSMGGAVGEEHAGEGFADGGMPQVGSYGKGSAGGGYGQQGGYNPFAGINFGGFGQYGQTSEPPMQMGNVGADTTFGTIDRAPAVTPWVAPATPAAGLGATQGGVWQMPTEFGGNIGGTGDSSPQNNGGQEPVAGAGQAATGGRIQKFGGGGLDPNYFAAMQQYQAPVPGGISGIYGNNAKANPGASSYVPAANQPVAHLMTASAPMRQTSSAGNDLRTAAADVNALKGMYSSGKAGLFGTPGVAAQGNNPAQQPTQGLAQWLGLSSDNAMPAARGGLIGHYADGGEVPDALDIPNDQPNIHSLQAAQAPGQGSSTLGGLRGLAGDIGAVGAIGKGITGLAGLFLANGGAANRHGYAEDGYVDDSADPQPVGDTITSRDEYIRTHPGGLNPAIPNMGNVETGLLGRAFPLPASIPGSTQAQEYDREPRIERPPVETPRAPAPGLIAGFDPTTGLAPSIPTGSIPTGSTAPADSKYKYTDPFSMFPPPEDAERAIAETFGGDYNPLRTIGNFSFPTVVEPNKPPAPNSPLAPLTPEEAAINAAQNATRGATTATDATVPSDVTATPAGGVAPPATYVKPGRYPHPTIQPNYQQATYTPPQGGLAPTPVADASQDNSFMGSLKNMADPLSIAFMALQGARGARGIPGAIIGAGAGAAQARQNLLNQEVIRQRETATTNQTVANTTRGSVGNIPGIGPGYWVVDPVSGQPKFMPSQQYNAMNSAGNAPAIYNGSVNQGGSTQAGAPIPAQQIGVPQNVQPAHPGVNFDDGSKRAATADGPQGPMWETKQALSGKYLQDTQAHSAEARASKPYTQEMISTLAQAANNRDLLNSPQFGAQTRASIVGMLNSVTRPFTGQNAFGSLDSDSDIINKITTLQASNSAISGDQHAVRALELFRGAIPNLSMHPEAASQLASQMLTLQQKEIDRADHAQMWGESNGNSGYANAASDFESKNDPQKYNREAQVIQRVMNNPAGAAFLKRVREGQGTPQQIENWFLRNTGVPGMGRYFGGLNGG